MSKPVLNPTFGGANQTQNFLKVKKINEVVSYYLNDRLTHSVYKAIVTQTSHKNVRSQNLFQVESKVPEAPELTTAEVAFHIKRLLEDGVVLQFAYFYVDPATSELKLKPCYVAYSDAELGDLTRIYLLLVDLSVNSILSYLENRPPLGKEMLWEDLEADFKGENIQKLKLFFNPESYFQAPNISIPLNPEYVKDMLLEITDGLVKKGRIREIPEVGYLVVKIKELQTLFELVDEFHFKKVFPKYKWALSDAFAAISQEERMYANDPSALPTTLFGKKRARAIEKALESDSEIKSKRKLIGVELILNLSDEIENTLKSSYQEQIRNRFHEMTDHLSKQAGRWDKLVLFISDEEFKTYPTELKRLLTEDRHIAYSPWETKGITIHSFMRMDTETIRSVIKSLSTAANVEAWKILGIRNLIELNEDSIHSVFKDEEFVRNYGKVLRKGYVRYFPWYFSILDFVGVAKLLQDLFFQGAKEKIRSEQSYFKSKNRDAAFKLEQSKIQEKLKEDEKIKALEQKSKLSEALNQYYFERNIPPVLKEILYEIPGYSPELIHQIVDREKFVLIQDSSGDKTESILMYPNDESFRFRAKEIHKVLTEKKKSLDFKFRNKEEDFQSEKVAKTLKYLDSWFASKPEQAHASKEGKNNSGNSNEDPYENFRKEIVKIKGKEKIST
ncbi:hypothetical protein [Leptospira interrogans]|uniref:Uncharacterized protein n=3 Tax=Leptospira interrogans TaxID=173 RepID=A0A0E2D1V3_LEPIR|nr:hypothetical protein [Leptospira interrogans]EMM79597.1 hypothetical protein LEP1GSC037_2746 [Leptospira interrogans str. 2006001854]EKR53555.1 hypothetical protein LEP1GSC105_2635 [Leptospira interrogans str. UI 12758]EMJ36394.1 hypothetical protein LEP1GSC079_3233 [Leptospira interrogans str. FPW1039]EMO00549.1 hypothetical protein LEP1GSC112_5015 [Leptospira interrogans serovar Pomona str. UT364]UML85196.1 hypothetical protein FH587_06675 [Leptospira interrogans]